MQRKYCQIDSCGFLLLETAIAFALFAMIAVTIFPTINFLIKRSKNSTFDTQATLLMQEGMEVAYNVIRSNWSSYQTGKVYHPILNTSTGRWQLNPNSELVEAKYTRKIEFIAVCRIPHNPGRYTTGTCTSPRKLDPYSLVIRTTITWKENGNTKDIHGELLLTSYTST